MTRVFYASTAFGAMSLAAGLDANLFGERSERRLLIVSTNTKVPELSASLADSVAFTPLRQRFDDIVLWNQVIAPMHPSHWVPPAAEVPLLSRMVRTVLDLDPATVTELVLESVAVAPARTIGMLIGDCPVTVYSDGLMSYGPTREDLPDEIGRRAGRLLYLDLVPELTPLLLRENQVRRERIPDAAFAKIIAELPEPAADEILGAPMIIGQYLSDLGLVTPAEEVGLYGDMLRGLAARGHGHVVFRPHPAAIFAQTGPLRALAADLGVRLTVADDDLPVEAWFARARPELVVSCFSTALLTAARYFDLPTATMGTDLMLERITPYQNSNRIPATIVDATVAQLTRDGQITTPKLTALSDLVASVGYCMQSARYPELRPVAASYLREFGPDRYFKRRRLERLGLVRPAPDRAGPLRLVVRQARRSARRIRTLTQARGR